MKSIFLEFQWGDQNFKKSCFGQRISLPNGFWVGALFTHREGFTKNPMIAGCSLRPNSLRPLKIPFFGPGNGNPPAPGIPCTKSILGRHLFLESRFFRKPNESLLFDRCNAKTLSGFPEINLAGFLATQIEFSENATWNFVPFHCRSRTGNILLRKGWSQGGAPTLNSGHPGGRPPAHRAAPRGEASPYPWARTRTWAPVGASRHLPAGKRGEGVSGPISSPAPSSS